MTCPSANKKQQQHSEHFHQLEENGRTTSRGDWMRMDRHHHDPISSTAPVKINSRRKLDQTRRKFNGQNPQQNKKQQITPHLPSVSPTTTSTAEESTDHQMMPIEFLAALEQFFSAMAIPGPSNSTFSAHFNMEDFAGIMLEQLGTNIGEQAQQLMSGMAEMAPGADPEELLASLWMSMSAQPGVAQQQLENPPMDEQFTQFCQSLLQIGATTEETTVGDNNDSGIGVDIESEEQRQRMMTPASSTATNSIHFQPPHQPFVSSTGAPVIVPRNGNFKHQQQCFSETSTTTDFQIHSQQNEDVEVFWQMAFANCLAKSIQNGIQNEDLMKAMMEWAVMVQQQNSHQEHEEVLMNTDNNGQRGRRETQRERKSGKEPSSPFTTSSSSLHSVRLSTVTSNDHFADNKRTTKSNGQRPVNEGEDEQQHKWEEGHNNGSIGRSDQQQQQTLLCQQLLQQLCQQNWPNGKDEGVAVDEDDVGAVQQQKSEQQNQEQRLALQLLSSVIGNATSSALVSPPSAVVEPLPPSIPIEQWPLLGMLKNLPFSLSVSENGLDHRHEENNGIGMKKENMTSDQQQRTKTVTSPTFSLSDQKTAETTHQSIEEARKYRRKKPREGKHRSGVGTEHLQFHLHSGGITPIPPLLMVPGTGTLTAKSEKSLGALLQQQPEGAERAEELDELEEFANFFKKQRIKHGFTQGDVGVALGKRYGTDFSQTTISRFEALNLSFKNMCKLRPLLQDWLEETDRLLSSGATVQDVLEGIAVQKVANIAAATASAVSQQQQQSLSVHSQSSSSAEDTGTAASSTGKVLPPFKKRRKRTNLDTSQKISLDAFFRLDSRPDNTRMNEIATLLDLDQDVVRVWFCNRRQKLRKI